MIIFALGVITTTNFTKTSVRIGDLEPIAVSDLWVADDLAAHSVSGGGPQPLKKGSGAKIDSQMCFMMSARTG